MLSDALLAQLDQLNAIEKALIIERLTEQLAVTKLKPNTGTFEVWSPEIDAESLAILRSMLTDAASDE